MRESGIKDQVSDRVETFQVGRYRVSLAAREVFLGEQRIKLSWRCFEAMELLVEAKAEIVEREDFFRRLWPGITVDESNLNHCIAQLRKQLGEAPEAGLIETVPRQGYRLSRVPQLIHEASVTSETAGTSLVPSSGMPASAVGPATRVRRIARLRFLVVLFCALTVCGIAMAFAWQRWYVRQQARSLTSEGFQLVRQGRVPQIGQANLLFRRAIELDPQLAPAYAGLAEGMARSGEARPEQARAMAEHALRLDSNCAECKAIAGWIMMTREWRFGEALSYLDDAVSQKPDDAAIRLWHAQMLASAGQLEQALKEINYAVALNASRAPSVTMRAGILYLSGRYEEAISTARQSLGLQPDSSSAWDWIYRSCIRLNRVEEAIAARAAVNAFYAELSADSRFELERRWTAVYKQRGLHGLVETFLTETSTKPTLDQHRYERATWRMWIGDREGALSELENVFDFRPFHCTYLAVDPMFQSLRGEPRFLEVLSRIGISTVLTKPRQ